jgi:hypothetical protein
MSTGGTLRNDERAAHPSPRFSQGRLSNPLQAKRRTQLQRPLGGDLDNPLPLRELVKFKLPVLAMDTPTSGSLEQRMSPTCLRRAS